MEFDNICVTRKQITMTEMKLYMQRCEEMRKQAMAERHAEATDEFGFCSGTTYKEWTAKTGMKGVSRKGKTFSHTKLWDYRG